MFKTKSLFFLCNHVVAVITVRSNSLAKTNCCFDAFFPYRSSKNKGIDYYEFSIFCACNKFLSRAFMQSSTINYDTTEYKVNAFKVELYRKAYFDNCVTVSLHLP